jgi:hypothetical protein
MMVDCSPTWYSTLKLFLENLKFSVNSIIDQGIGSCQAIIRVVELQLHGSKLRGQKLLDGLHCMPLLSLKCLLWSGTPVAGDVVQLHARSPRVWDDNLGGVDGEQLGEGPGVGGAD